MKRFITLFLWLFLLALLLAGCGKSKNNQQTETQQDAQQGQQKSAVVSSSPSVQPFSLNIPDKSLIQNLAIVGKVAPGYRMFINEKEYPVDSSGNIKAQVSLLIGNNPINIRIISSDGKAVYTTTKNVEFAPKPKMEVQTIQVLGNSLTVTGTTDPNSIVDVNGDKTQADGTGNFTITTPLNGEDSVRILSTNQASKTSIIEQELTTTSGQSGQTNSSTSTSSANSTIGP